MQARALAERGARLSPDELSTALEASTTLPVEVIARLARARGEENTAARAERARAADLDRAAAAHSARPARQWPDRSAARHVIADTAGAHAVGGPDRSPARGRELPLHGRRRHPGRRQRPAPAAGPVAVPHGRRPERPAPRARPVRYWQWRQI